MNVLGGSMLDQVTVKNAQMTLSREYMGPGGPLCGLTLAQKLAVVPLFSILLFVV